MYRIILVVVIGLLTGAVIAAVSIRVGGLATAEERLCDCTYEDLEREKQESLNSMRIFEVLYSSKKDDLEKCEAENKKLREQQNN